jgi:hypothetical protein
VFCDGVIPRSVAFDASVESCGTGFSGEDLASYTVRFTVLCACEMNVLRCLFMGGVFLGHGLW